MEKIINGLFSGNSSYQLVIQQEGVMDTGVYGTFKYKLFLKRNPTFLNIFLPLLLSLLRVNYTNYHLFCT